MIVLKQILIESNIHRLIIKHKVTTVYIIIKINIILNKTKKHESFICSSQKVQFKYKYVNYTRYKMSFEYKTVRKSK